MSDTDTTIRLTYVRPHRYGATRTLPLCGHVEHRLGATGLPLYVARPMVGPVSVHSDLDAACIAVARCAQ